MLGHAEHAQAGGREIERRADADEARADDDRIDMVWRCGRVTYVARSRGGAAEHVSVLLWLQWFDDVEQCRHSFKILVWIYCVD